MFKWIYENLDIDATIDFGRWKGKKVSELTKDELYWMAYKSFNAKSIVKKSARRRLEKEA
ncbi:MAG: hypothetical protein ACTSQE_12360 [Candidatus Heimdallarchaeaceae archaeon]